MIAKDLSNKKIIDIFNCAGNCVAPDNYNKIFCWSEKYPTSHNRSIVKYSNRVKQYFIDGNLL
jgi:hypothetical protein